VEKGDSGAKAIIALWIKHIGQTNNWHWTEVEIAYVACVACKFLDLNVYIYLVKLKKTCGPSKG
jgi:hypothetical protein